MLKSYICEVTLQIKGDASSITLHIGGDAEKVTLHTGGDVEKVTLHIGGEILHLLDLANRRLPRLRYLTYRR